MNKIARGWNLENSYLELPEIFYSKMRLNPVSEPRLILLNDSLASSLGLNTEELKSKSGIDTLAGNNIPKGSIPLSQAYGGHQFGHFTMLGDGRAILLGEQIDPKGNRFDIQLKGSGRTPYSRGGDGRAALGPMLREYIISEALCSLGIPTTRSLAVVTTGDKVYRQTPLDGAILTRVAKSHIRVGTFQYAANWGSYKDLKDLADYTIERHFHHIEEDKNPYISLLKETMSLQASLIAQWQLVGFIHGVMNTDNMTIAGETIDYGPCAFMDSYDPATVFSSIDRHGRYAYGNQPKMGVWNLYRFAESILPLIDEDRDKSIEIAEEILEDFDEIFQKYWLKGMRSKLGIFNEEKDDETFIEELLNMMKKHRADYTNTFVHLTYESLNDEDLFKEEDFKIWKDKWIKRLSRQDQSMDLSKELMKKSNPAVIPRNYQVEKALKSAVEDKDLTELKILLNILSSPYDYDKIPREYMKSPDPSFLPYVTYCGT